MITTRNDAVKSALRLTNMHRVYIMMGEFEADTDLTRLRLLTRNPVTGSSTAYNMYSEMYSIFPEKDATHKYNLL